MTTTLSPTVSASRKPSDQAAAIEAVIDDMKPANGPPGLRRCRLQQDRSRAARRLSPWPAASRSPSSADHLCSAEQHFQTFSDRFALTGRLAGSSAVALQDRQGNGAGAGKNWPTASVDIVIGTHKAAAERRQIHRPASSSSTRNTASACARKKR